MCESKPWVTHPGPIKEIPDQNQRKAEDHKCDEQDMTEKKQIGGEEVQEAGLHVEHLISCAKSEDNISIASDCFSPAISTDRRNTFVKFLCG